MIYEVPKVDDPIRQGDIFRGLPRIDLRLPSLPLIEGGETVQTSWDDVISSGKTEVTVVVGVRVIDAIVITQDCDAVHANQITLCEIRPFKEVERKAADTKSDASWTKILTQQTRLNLKYFYLPPEPSIGFAEKMGADFQVTTSILRSDLEALRKQRIARLNPESDEHFRERLSEFFRRYPVDEWYPLSKSEFAIYQTNYPDAKPRPGQV